MPAAFWKEEEEEDEEEEEAFLLMKMKLHLGVDSSFSPYHGFLVALALGCNDRQTFFYASSR